MRKKPLADYCNVDGGFAREEELLTLWSGEVVWDSGGGSSRHRLLDRFAEVFLR
jgi:hypothetical protein